MRILHITKKYPNALGGDANVVRSLELHQKRSGHEVAILTTNSVEIQQNENVIRFGLPDTATNLDIITLKGSSHWCVSSSLLSVFYYISNLT
jgi:glycogen synthase